jgi:hypothetical protein
MDKYLIMNIIGLRKIKESVSLLSGLFSVFGQAEKCGKLITNFV